MPRPLRVAVVGLGYGASHVAAFQACRDVEVAAVCSRTRESAESVGERYGVGLRTADYEEVLGAGVDAVALATPPGLRKELALAAMARGIHVLCEKPLALDAAEGQELLAAAEEAGVVHAVNYDYRVIPDHHRFHELLADGYAGEVRHAHLYWMSDHNADESTPWGWRHDRRQAGFGALGDMHHILDDAIWYFGPVDRVSADFRTIIPKRRDATQGRLRRNDVEDAAAWVAITRGGAQVEGQVSRCAPGAAYRWIECFGSKGMLRLSMPDHAERFRTGLVGARLGGGLEDLSLAGGEPLETTQSRFVAAIRSPEVSVITSFRDGVEVLRLADAMRQSSETGRAIDCS